MSSHFIRAIKKGQQPVVASFKTEAEAYAAALKLHKEGNCDSVQVLRRDDGGRETVLFDPNVSDSGTSASSSGKEPMAYWIILLVAVLVGIAISAVLVMTWKH